MISVTIFYGQVTTAVQQSDERCRYKTNIEAYVNCDGRSNRQDWVFASSVAENLIVVSYPVRVGEVARGWKR